MIPNTLATIRTYLRSAADTRATGYATEYSYRPAEKRLTDHRRRTLSYADITQYRSICAALAEMPPHWGFEISPRSTTANASGRPAVPPRTALEPPARPP